MKKIILFLFCVSFMSILWSQENPELPNIVPPSPTAYELGKFGQIDVGMYTGTPNVSVPLYTFRTTNLSVPISLRYNSNGIKVDQMASWVGLGWSLNAGGVITRIIRDLPDERYGVRVPPRELTPSNQLATDIQDFAILAEDATSDTERDLFMFNFNGYSGRFTITDTGIIVAPSQPIKITYTDLFSTSSSFEVTTPDGIKYLFAEHEKSNGTGGCVPSDGLFPITSWYLSNITHPNGDVINFVYESESYRYEVGVSQSFSKNKNALGGGCLGGGAQCPDLTASTPCITFSQIQGKRLAEINSTNASHGKILFSEGIRNPDIPVGPSYGDQLLLDNIEVIAPNDDVVERFDLNYQFEKKRTFLSSVVFLDPSKKYGFDYNSPSLLPDRLNYGQDYWGYYNGQNNLVFYPKVLEEPLLANYGANREPNSSFAIYGLLNKMTYPTKGTTEFEYEPNIVKETGSLEYNTENLSFQLDDATESFTFTADANASSTLLSTLNLRIFENSTSPCTGIPDFMEDTPFNTIWFNATLHDLTTGDAVFFNNISSTLLQSNRPFNPVEGTFTIQPNHQYRLDLEKGNSCIYGIANLSYTTRSISQELVEREIGGLRIKRLTNKGNVNGNSEMTRYYYGSKDNLSGSSASEGNRGYYLNDQTIQLICFISDIGAYPYDCEYTQVSSSSVVPLFNTNDNQPYYQYVTVSHGGDNFENGGEEYTYLIDRDTKGETVFSRYAYIPDNSTFSNTGWSNGLLKNKSVFKLGPADTFIDLEQTENFYNNDTRNFKQVFNYKVIKRHQVTVYYNDDYPTDQIDIIKYRDNSYWHYLDSTITKVFDTNGNNPITTATSYSYENPIHQQPTLTKSNNSKGEEITTKTFYPDDISSVSSLGAPALTTPEKNAIDQLKTGSLHRVATPLQVETEINGKKTAQRTIYKDWYVLTAPDPDIHLVWPEYIQTLKGEYGAANILHDRIHFKNYDTNGNLREVSKADGTSIAYIWGYDETYPIAKIENAMYTDINNSVASLQSLSDLDDDRTIGASGNEGALRTALNSFRDALPNAMVTTYTYDPLIGVTSMTGPRGYTIYYEYDAFNRLKEVKDAAGNLVTDYEYNYKSE